MFNTRRANSDEVAAALQSGSVLRNYKTARGPVVVVADVSGGLVCSGVSVGQISNKHKHSINAIADGYATYANGAHAAHTIGADGRVSTVVPLDAPSDEKGRWEHNRQLIERRAMTTARLRKKLEARKAAGGGGGH
jgi:hypothetical protein